MARTKKADFTEPILDSAMASVTTDEKVVVKSDFIALLELNIDLGRQDLNNMVGKLEDKINELVRKSNK